MKHISFLIFSIIGALAAIFLLNRLLGMTYSSEGSWDIVTGAFVETFVLTCFYQFFQARHTAKQDKKTQRQHTEIISLLRQIQWEQNSSADPLHTCGASIAEMHHYKQLQKDLNKKGGDQ